MHGRPLDMYSPFDPMDPRQAPLRVHGTDMGWAWRQPDGNRTQRVFAYFMRKAAEHGRGTFTFIGDVHEVATRMEALFRKLERPALTDIVVEWPAAVEVWPRALPDVHAGEP